MSYKCWGDRILNKPDDEHPDERSLGLTLGRYCLVSASVRGKMHIRNGIPREDAVAVHHKDDCLAVAVSDGVGSSKYSRLGASCAVNKVCENLFHQIEELTATRKGVMQFVRGAEPGPEGLEKAVTEAFRKTADDLKEHAERLAKALECPELSKSPEDPKNNDIVASSASVATSTTETVDAPERDEQTIQKAEIPKQKPDLSCENNTPTLNDLHCTLLAIVLNVKWGSMAVAQIGDGLILGLTEDLKATPLVEPQMPGQTGQTYVITQKDWERYLSVKVITGEQSKDYITIYLMTDGVADDCQYGPPEDVLQRWANDMNSEIRKYDVETTKARLAKYLNDYQVKGSYDDRTLVALYRRIRR